MATNFTQQLLEIGIVTAMPDQAEELARVVATLKEEGHAVLLAEDIVNGKSQNVTAHHYRTCNACLAKRKGESTC